MITQQEERRLREIVKLSRDGVKLAEGLFSKPGTHSAPYWLNKEIYIVGKRKMKAYYTRTGRSYKKESILIGETSAKINGMAYADLSELIEDFIIKQSEETQY